MDENLELGYYDDTAILPTISISDLNRREVKNLARTIAGRSNPLYGVTYGEVLNDKVNIDSKSSNQQNRFKRLVKKQYDKNVLHTQQLERAKRAGLGDVKAMQDYITTGTNEVAPYVAPLLAIPTASVIAGTGVVTPALKHTFKVMANPAKAKTTVGAMAATGLDAFGVAAGTRGLSDMVGNRWLKGKFNWSDIPEFALNVADIIPGAAAINATVGAALDMKRVRNAAKYINEAVSDINTPATRVGTDLDIDAPTNNPVEVRPTGLRAPTNINPNDVILRTPSQESISVHSQPTLVEHTAPTPVPTPPQFTVDFNGLLLSRLDVERLLRDAGYDRDIVSEALMDFDRADINDSPYDFYYSPTARRLDRALRGLRATDVELADGSFHNVNDVIDLLRREGLTEDAINRRINTAIQGSHPIDPTYINPYELTDEGLTKFINNLNEHELIDFYQRSLTRQRHIDIDPVTERYRSVTRNLSNEDQRVFNALSKKLSLDYAMNFSDLSEDNYVAIKQFLRSKGYTAGDIEHMNWFQMRDALPRDSYGNVIITEADGTVRPIKYGERPQFTDKGRYQTGKKALQMFEDVPRGYAVAETNTSLDSELLKLNGASRRYGFGPGQFSVELAKTNPRGNNYQFERMYMRDMLYYKDLLPDNEKVLLDKILDGKYGTEVRWEDLQGTGLLDLLKYEYLDLTNKLIKRLSAPWEKIKAVDSRPEIQQAPMPSYNGNIDSDIDDLLSTGNFSPRITRLPTHIFKHSKGGLIGKTMNLIGCNNPILKSQKFLKGGKIGKFTTGGYIPKHQNSGGGITLVGKDRRKGLKERVKAWWNDLPKDYSDGMCALDAKGNPTGNCAKYSNDVLKKQGYTSIGDAWTRVPFSGAKVLYTGYDKNLPKEYSDSAYWAYLNGAADKIATQIDPNTLQDYDIVSLVAQGSNATQEAYNEGKKHGRIHTHTGHIRIGDDGERYVVHNVHERLYQNKLSDLMGGNKPFSVVEIARPRK